MGRTVPRKQVIKVPVIRLSTNKSIEDNQKKELAVQLGQAIEIVPNKAYEKSTIIIEDNCCIYRGGEPAQSVFIEVRFNEKIAFEYKDTYTAKAFEIVQSILDVPYEHTAINFLEMVQNWGSKGKLK